MSSVAELWKEAISHYETETKIKLVDCKIPFARVLESCNSADAVISVVQNEKDSFAAFRATGAKSRKVLKVIASVLLVPVEPVAEGVADLVPGGKGIFVAFGMLLKATKGVSETYDALDTLLSRLQGFLERLEMYIPTSTDPFTPELPPKLRDIFVQTLTHLLRAFALFTKYVNNYTGRWEKLQRFRFNALKRAQDYGKVLLKDTGVQSTLDKLEELTKAESLAVLAELYATVMKMQKGQKYAALRDWLKPPDPSPRHEILQKAKEQGTCDWFFDDRFDKWLNLKRAIYWAHGIPDAGKSVLSSSTIEMLKKDRNRTVIYFYVYYSDEPTRDLRGLLSSMIFQLATSSKSCYDACEARRASEYSQMNLYPSCEYLLSCLEALLVVSPGVIIVIDGLDESPRDTRTDDLLPFLRTLVDFPLEDMHLLITSRPEDDIQRELTQLASKIFLSRLNLHDASALRAIDIARHIHAELDKLCSTSQWPVGIRELAEEVLNRGAKGMFLWVSLQLKLLRDASPINVEAMLEDLPLDIDSTYKRILESLLRRGKREAGLTLRVFQCLAFSREAFEPDELAEIFATDFNDVDGAVIKSEFRESEPWTRLVQACSSMIDLRKIDTPSPEVVQFVHFSAQEYLLSDRLHTSVQEFRLDEIGSHLTLLQLCLATLNGERERGHPLFRYALFNWPSHLRALFGSTTHEIPKAIDTSLRNFFNPELPIFARWLSDCGRLGMNLGPGPVTGSRLYWAAMLGIVSHSKALLELLESDAERPPPEVREALFRYHHRDTSYRLAHTTFLHIAAEGAQHLPFYVLCRRREVSIDIRDAAGRTPLHIAAERSDYGLVGYLHLYAATVDARDDDERTPLHLLARSATASSPQGTLRAAAALVSQGADINAADKKGNTPLTLAETAQCRDLVRVLHNPSYAVSHVFERRYPYQ